MPIASSSRGDLALARIDWRQVDATPDAAIDRRTAADADAAPVFSKTELLPAAWRIGPARSRTCARRAPREPRMGGAGGSR